MSRKNLLLHAMQKVIAETGGAHLTREARERIARKFADFVFDAGFTHVVNVMDISGKQFRAYIHKRHLETANVRTLQNEAAILRKILRRGGRKAIADASELSNKALGIAGGSRIGKKTAMSYEEYCRARDAAFDKGRPGIAAILRLEWVLGLRGNEALHARLDVLRRWEREAVNGSILVLEGTKGGRMREVQLFDIDAALAAIREAIEVAERQGGFLIIRANGRPSAGLKQARSIYHGWAKRNRIVPHQARCSFAQNQFDEYERAGLTKREALAATSADLGHGHGRGRYVRSVYDRRNMAAAVIPGADEGEKNPSHK